MEALTDEQIDRELLRPFPVGCRPNFRPCTHFALWFIHAKTDVKEGRASLEEAQDRLAPIAEDVRQNCRMGQLGVEGCFGGQACQYGLAHVASE